MEKLDEHKSITKTESIREDDIKSKYDDKSTEDLRCLYLRMQVAYAL